MIRKGFYSFSLILLLSTTSNVFSSNNDATAACIELCADCTQACADCGCDQPSDEQLACADCLSLKLSIERNEDVQAWAQVAEFTHAMIENMASKEDAVNSMKELYSTVRNAHLSGSLNMSAGSTFDEKEEPASTDEDEMPAMDLETIINSNHIDVTLKVENRKCHPDAWNSIATRTVEIINRAQEEENDEAIFNHYNDICAMISETEGLHGSIHVLAKNDAEMNQE